MGLADEITFRAAGDGQWTFYSSEGQQRTGGIQKVQEGIVEYNITDSLKAGPSDGSAFFMPWLVTVPFGGSYCTYYRLFLSLEKFSVFQIY